MVQWANCGYGGRVNFLLLCVENGRNGLRTAKSFGQQFQVPSSVVNAYIENKSESPRFGQLGCGGFIVLGPYGEFVAPRTAPAYLKSGPLAFRSVEKILGSLGVNAASPTAAAPAPSSGKLKLQLAHVGNAQMDQEHRDLVAAGADLMKQRSLASLGHLSKLWAEHSTHEEALFEKHNFGGAQGGDLSGTASHRQHHRAILQSFNELLESFDKGTDHSACGVIGEEAVQELVAELQRHGDVYDSAYAGKLGESEVENLIRGAGQHGTKWMWSWRGGEFEIEFNRDGSFYCNDYPRDATWQFDGWHIIIDWADLGTYEMKVDVAGGTMSGCYKGHPDDWRYAKCIGDQDRTRM